MDFLTTHASLLNVSARLTMAGIAHDFADVDGLPALVGELAGTGQSFTVTRDGIGYMVEAGGMGTPCATVEDVVCELGMVAA